MEFRNRIDHERIGCGRCKECVNGREHRKKYDCACEGGDSLGFPFKHIPADRSFINDYPWWRPNWCMHEVKRVQTVKEHDIKAKGMVSDEYLEIPCQFHGQPDTRVEDSLVESAESLGECRGSIETSRTRKYRPIEHQ